MGDFHVDAQLISISERKVIDGKMKRSPLPAGFRFLNVSPAVEREVATDYFRLTREAEKERIKVREYDISR